MSNIIDYVKWRGDLSLESSKFNEIDSLILNRFSYFPLDNIIREHEEISIQKLGKRFENEEKEKLNILWEDDAILFPIMAESKRFGNMKALEYVNIIDKKAERQFSAITVILPDDTIYISFRGTDNTLVGWKEDFNLGFKSHIASQVSAKEYLEKMAEKFSNKKIRVGGHSKGGNLAIYSAIYASKKVQDRILAVYNNDGPGFLDDIVNTKEYKNIINKVITYIPQNSIFGLLLEHREKNVIVNSIEKGAMQHDVYSWQVLGKDFVILNEITNGSKFIDKTIKDWIKNSDAQTRGQIIDIVFEIINTTNINKVNEFKLSIMKNAGIVLSSYSHIDSEDKKMINKAIGIFLEILKDNAIERYKSKSKNKDKEKIKCLN